MYNKANPVRRSCHIKLLSTPKKILRQEGDQRRILLLGETKKRNTMSAIWDGKEERISKLRTRIQFYTMGYGLGRRPVVG
jgi:hypothetical protein